ncbi:hypothetical protein GQ44DRAFT_733711 [Phaeosphaeriaceae sp. PMI808]|nr:hypothetical protein GQ44DRAFT_733711 [Phaeosphaeriaceae sp. PMI808]
MILSIPFSASVWLIFSSLLGFVTSQNDTTTTNNQTCRWSMGNVNFATPVNATRRARFQWDKEPNAGRDWQFSVVVNASDLRGQGQPFISVPEQSKDEVYLYKYPPLNISASGGGLNGCEGVLTQACITALSNITLPRRPSSDLAYRMSCVGARNRQNIKDACSKDVTSFIGYSS